MGEKLKLRPEDNISKHETKHPGFLTADGKEGIAYTILNDGTKVPLKENTYRDIYDLLQKNRIIEEAEIIPTDLDNRLNIYRAAHGQLPEGLNTYSVNNYNIERNSNLDESGEIKTISMEYRRLSFFTLAKDVEYRDIRNKSDTNVPPTEFYSLEGFINYVNNFSLDLDTAFNQTQSNKRLSSDNNDKYYPRLKLILNKLDNPMYTSNHTVYTSDKILTGDAGQEIKYKINTDIANLRIYGAITTYSMPEVIGYVEDPDNPRIPTVNNYIVKKHGETRPPGLEKDVPSGGDTLKMRFDERPSSHNLFRVETSNEPGNKSLSFFHKEYIKKDIEATPEVNKIMTLKKLVICENGHLIESVKKDTYSEINDRFYNKEDSDARFINTNNTYGTEIIEGNLQVLKDMNVLSNLKVLGDMNVEGDKIILNTTDSEFEDPIITIGSKNEGTTQYVGALLTRKMSYNPIAVSLFNNASISNVSNLYSQTLDKNLNLFRIVRDVPLDTTETTVSLKMKPSDISVTKYRLTVTPKSLPEGGDLRVSIYMNNTIIPISAYTKLNLNTLTKLTFDTVEGVIDVRVEFSITGVSGAYIVETKLVLDSVTDSENIYWDRNAMFAWNEVDKAVEMGLANIDANGNVIESSKVKSTLYGETLDATADRTMSLEKYLKVEFDQQEQNFAIKNEMIASMRASYTYNPYKKELKFNLAPINYADTCITTMQINLDPNPLDSTTYIRGVLPANLKVAHTYENGVLTERGALPVLNCYVNIWIEMDVRGLVNISEYIDEDTGLPIPITELTEEDLNQAMIEHNLTQADLLKKVTSLSMAEFFSGVKFNLDLPKFTKRIMLEFLFGDTNISTLDVSEFFVGVDIVNNDALVKNSFQFVTQGTTFYKPVTIPQATEQQYGLVRVIDSLTNNSPRPEKATVYSAAVMDTILENTEYLLRGTTSLDNLDSNYLITVSLLHQLDRRYKDFNSYFYGVLMRQLTIIYDNVITAELAVQDFNYGVSHTPLYDEYTNPVIAVNTVEQGMNSNVRNVAEASPTQYINDAIMIAGTAWQEKGRKWTCKWKKKHGIKYPSCGWHGYDKDGFNPKYENGGVMTAFRRGIRMFRSWTDGDCNTVFSRILYTGGGTNHKGVFFPAPLTMGNIRGVIGSFSGGEYSEYTMALYKVPYDTPESDIVKPDRLDYYKTNHMITSVTANLKELVEKGGFGQPLGNTPFLLYKAEEGVQKFVITLEHRTTTTGFHKNGVITSAGFLDQNHMIDIQYMNIDASRPGYVPYIGAGINRWDLASSVSHWSNSYKEWYGLIRDTSVPIIGDIFAIAFAPLGVITSFISDLFSGNLFKSKERVDNIHLLARHPELQIFRSLKVRYIKYIDVYDGIEALFKNK